MDWTQEIWQQENGKAVSWWPQTEGLSLLFWMMDVPSLNNWQGYFIFLLALSGALLLIFLWLVWGP